MLLLDTATHSPDAIRRALTERDTARDLEIETTVRAIVDDVRARGDAALLDYTRRFDWPAATLAGLAVPSEAFENPEDAITEEIADTLLSAGYNITMFHELERGHLQSWMEFTGRKHLDKSVDAVALGQKLQPVKRVGVYVPGGKGAYPSTVLMAVIPAIIAGVEEIILCTPPDNGGNINRSCSLLSIT